MKDVFISNYALGHGLSIYIYIYIYMALVMLTILMEILLHIVEKIAIVNEIAARNGHGTGGLKDVLARVDGRQSVGVLCGRSKPQTRSQAAVLSSRQQHEFQIPAVILLHILVFLYR